ncbi:MAG: ABC transporter transmembrane domain-containing protein [Planctomycetota bacterium]
MVKRLRQRLATALAVWIRLLPYLRPYRRKLAAAGVLTVLVVGVEILKPWILKVVIDQVLLGKPWQALPADWHQEPTTLLVAAVLATVALAGIGGIGTFWRDLWLATAGQRAIARVRRDALDAVLHQPLEFHERHRAGDLLVRLCGDAQNLRTLLVDGLFALGRESLMLVGTLAVMAAVDWRLALAAAGVLPVIALLLAVFSVRLRRAARKQRKKEGELATAAHETLAATAVVQAYGLEDVAAGAFDKQNKKSARASLTATRLEGHLGILTDLAIALGTAVVLWLGVGRVQAGAMHAGELVAMVVYTRTFYRPIRKGLGRSATMVKAGAAGERVLELLLAPRPTAAAATPAPAARGDVALRGVAFRHGDGREVLSAADLHVRAGEHVAIVGDNGAGKTTLAMLLPRLREAQRGEVLLDGLDVRRYDAAELRRRIAVVFQESILFDGTLRENLQFGDLDADADAVAAAAELAGVTAFAARLPGGLDARVGGSAVPSSPAASGSAWRWRACCATPRSTSSTNRRRASTPAPGRTSATACSPTCAAARCCSSPMTRACSAPSIASCACRTAASPRSTSAPRGRRTEVRRERRHLLPAAGRRRRPAFLRALELDAVAALVGERLLVDGELRGLRPDYVRWKDRDGSLLGYRTTVRTADGDRETYVTARTAAPHRLADEAARLQHRTDEQHSGLRAFAFLPEADLLLLSFPIDRALGDLRRFVRASKVKALIAAACPELVPAGRRILKKRSRCHIVRYKPERRAVLHWDLALVADDGAPPARRSLWLRCYSAPQARARAPPPRRPRRPACAARARWRCRTTGCCSSRTSTAPPGSRARPATPAAAPRRRRSGDCTAPRWRRRCRTTGRSTNSTSCCAPPARTWRACAPGSAASPPPSPTSWPTACRSAAPWCLSHGDMHPGQVLLATDGGDAGLCDFDRARIAPAALDLASMFAHGIANGGERGEAAARRFWSDYAFCRPLPAAAELHWWCACALVARRRRRSAPCAPIGPRPPSRCCIAPRPCSRAPARRRGRERRRRPLRPAARGAARTRP